MPEAMPQAPNYRQSTSRDAAEHALNLSQWDQTYDQLKGGCFEGRLDELWLSDLQLFRERTNRGLLETGSAWPGSRTFGVPLAMDGRGYFCGQHLGLHDVLTIGPTDELNFRTPEHMDIVGITLPANTFNAYWRAAIDPPADAWMQNQVIRGPHHAVDALRALLLQIFAAVESQTSTFAAASVQRQVREQILEHLVEVLHDAMPTPKVSLTLRTRRDIVDKARELARVNTEEPPSVADLCASLRVSRRTLQTSFQEILGLSPHQYLHAYRLNRLRHTLQHPDAPTLSVQDAAARWGFWHLSAVAADYRRMFGELPSATLRASRALL